MSRRRHRLGNVELFAAGIGLGIGFGYVIEGAPIASALAILLTGILAVDALRRGAAESTWLMALAFCASLSRLPPAETAAALDGALVPLIVGGSVVALAVGLVVDTELKRQLRLLLR